jgi:hypothetical protein
MPLLPRLRITLPDRAVRRLSLVILLVALAVHSLVLWKATLPRGRVMDFFIFYVFARAPLAGHSPYDTGAVDYDNPIFRTAAVEHYKWWGFNGEIPEAFKHFPFGLFYPPQAYLLFLPFSRLSWNGAIVGWMAFLTACSVCCGALTWVFDDRSQPRPLASALTVAVFLLNPLTQMYFGIGQSAVILCGSVALGMLMLRKGYYWAGVVAWSFCAIKPQLGFPLVILTFMVGGWRFFRDVSISVVALNVLGGLAMTRDPFMMFKMFANMNVHATNFWNSALTFKLVSWNRIFHVLFGPVIELSTPLILLGHIGWISLLALSAVFRGGRQWSLPYWVAAAGIGSVFFGLSHDYDLVILVLLVPYLFWLWGANHRVDALFVGFLLALVAFTPKAGMTTAADLLKLGTNSREIFLSLRGLILAVLAAYLLLRGQPRGLGDVKPRPDGLVTPEAS